MSRLEIILSELKAATNSPRVYLVNYFDDIRSQIDIECQFYLNRPFLEVDKTEQAIRYQDQMTNEVDMFQRKCLANVGTIPIDLKSLNDLEDRFNSVDSGDEEFVSNIEKDIYCALFEIKKLLFLNKGIIFINLEKCEKFIEPTSKQIDSQILFGLLFLIEDEFILYSDKFKQIKSEQISNNDWSSEFLRIEFMRKRLKNELVDEREIRSGNGINTDWCNEYLRVHYMKKHLETRLVYGEGSNVPVDRIRLKLDRQETLEYFYCKKMILKDCLVLLPALKKVVLISCYLKDLDPTTFQSLANLEELDLSFNLIRSLHPETFSSNKRLKVLGLSGNAIESLSGGLFRGLFKLSQLFVYNNAIRFIPEGLFQDLVSLRFLYLDNNAINFLDENGRPQSASVFKGLVNLILLELGCNSISTIPKGIFKHLVSLENLHLYGNKLNFYDLYETSKYLKGFKSKFKIMWNQSTIS